MPLPRRVEAVARITGLLIQAGEVGNAAAFFFDRLLENSGGLPVQRAVTAVRHHLAKEFIADGDALSIGDLHNFAVAEVEAHHRARRGHYHQAHGNGITEMELNGLAVGGLHNGLTMQGGDLYRGIEFVADAAGLFVHAVQMTGTVTIGFRIEAFFISHVLVPLVFWTDAPPGSALGR